jgi:hypothetical protein
VNIVTRGRAQDLHDDDRADHEREDGDNRHDAEDPPAAEVGAARREPPGGHALSRDHADWARPAAPTPTTTIRT